ncbi:MAG: trimethylamine methyltransferase family protein [Halofilum sp. (in: g-proteobacteria)]|nr:trimethylamine methyltransferase family protein [Halofilum sp. (in: g-proteobacteria)]
MARHRGGRAARRAAREADAATSASAAIVQPEWSQLRYTDPPVEPLDAEGVERIHEAAMTILEEIGIEFLHEDARKRLADAGCTVEGENVRMGRDFVMEMVGHAPSSFTITPRNPDHAVTIGDGMAAFCPVASAPNVSDLEGGRRTGNRKDFQNLLKLAQGFNVIHLTNGYPVEPVDIHASIRHLDAIYDLLTLTDKAIHAYALGVERIEDAMEMVRIAGGLTWEEFEAKPRMYTNINSSSPLKHDWPMLDGAMRLAEHAQPVIVAPFTLAGAMAPITLAGAIAQQTAEGLAAIALLQYIRPGTPVVYGAFTSNVDMQTGAPAFGTPEYMRAAQMSGQMARRYELPLRSSNANAANYPDAQATWESCNSIHGALSAHAGIVFHAAGWLEGGLCASFEKMVIDCEILQQWNHYHRAISTEPEDLGLDAIREVGPHGHFLGAEHTQARYKGAFYAPFLSEWSNYERWEAEGAEKTDARAARIARAMIDAYQAPPMDEGLREELEAFVAKRKEEGGAPTDF